MLKKLLLALLLLTAVANATEPTEESITKLYIATFDRAPDAAGLNYWFNDSGLSLEKIAKSFFDQEETQEKYPPEYSNEDFIIEVYDNLFGRAPDSEGFDYWRGELDADRVSRDIFILTVMNGAQENDADILNNKTVVGLAFAHDGRSCVDEARAVMKGVTADPQSVTDTLCGFWLSGCLIVHNGTTYSYVTSPYTAKIWLDRNLGAAQVCTSLDDVACYGDYYQWGRNSDGHQNSTSGIADTLAMDVNNAGTEYIRPPSSLHDWVAGGVDDDGSIRVANWSKTDGTSVCPVGFRVPTEDELEAEHLGTNPMEISDKYDIFNSFLKLPSAGLRTYSCGCSVNLEGSWGYLWASSADGFESSILIWGSSVGWANVSRASGRSVRCLRD